MKRTFLGKNHFLKAANSRLVYVLLVATMVVLFCYVFFAQRRMAAYYEKAQAYHRLSVLALWASEENYHTQLEIYEVFSTPSQKRIDDFYFHDAELSRRLASVYKEFYEYRQDLPPEVMEKLEELLTSTPKLRRLWIEFIESVQKKRPRAEQEKILFALEDLFDSEGFNGKIRGLVVMQLAEVNRAEKNVADLTRNTTLTVMAGMFVTVCLMGIMLILHRAALRGKANELMLVQAGKLASLGQLSAGMAHELNSPLMFIQGYNGRVRQALKKSNFDEKAEVWEYIDEVDQGISRIKGIVGHFREFSRLSHNQMKPVRLNALVQRSFSLFGEQLRLRDIAVKLDLSDENPTILADANRIEQVLLNLISNARDAIVEAPKSNERRISVTTKCDEHTVALLVADSGVGIEPAHLSRIFDPFFTTKPVGIGTGLGLSISLGIIRDHHGRVVVESESGQDTVFTITFPRASDEPS